MLLSIPATIITRWPEPPVPSAARRVRVAVAALDHHCATPRSAAAGTWEP